jgi:hypothetical protein
MSTARSLSRSFSGQFSVVNPLDYRAPPGARIDRKSIEYLPLLSQWVRFAKNLWTTDRRPTLASLDVIFMAPSFVAILMTARGFVGHVLLSATRWFVAMSQTSMGSFRRKASWTDSIFRRRLATNDLSGLRLHFAASCPATNRLKVWVRWSHFFLTPVGSFVAPADCGSFCPSAATSDNGPRTKKTIPPLPIMCAAHTFARSFDDFRKYAIGTIDAIERTGRFPNNVALSTTGLPMARPKLAVAGFNRSPRSNPPRKTRAASALRSGVAKCRRSAH